MGLELRTRVPHFHPAAKALALLLIAGLVFLLWQFPGGSLDLDILQRYADRMLNVYDASRSAPEWQRDLMGESVRSELEREMLAAYQKEDLDGESAFQFALIQWRFNKDQAALATLETIEEENYAPLIALVRHRLNAGPAPDLPIVESAAFAVANSETWWSYFLRNQFPEFNLQAGPELVIRQQTMWSRIFWLQILDWMLLFAALVCLFLTNRTALTRGVGDKYFLWLGSQEGVSFFWAFVWALLLFAVLGSALYLPFQLLDLTPSALVEALIETISRITPALVLAWWFSPSWRCYSRAWGLNIEWRGILKWTAVGLVLGGIAESLIVKVGMIFESPGLSDALDPALLAAGWSGLAGQIWMAGVAAPIGEELLFRGMLYPVLRRRIGVWPALVAQSALFASIHLYSWIGAISVFLIGLLFGWLFEKSRSLWPPLIVHSIGNITATLIVWLLFGKAF